MLNCLIGVQVNHPIHVDYALGVMVVHSAADVKIEDIYDTIAKLEQIAEETGIHKALLDLRAEVSLPSMIEMFEMAKKFPKTLWIAAVLEASREIEEEVEFVETVAKNRGAPLRIFREEDEALEWLQLM